MDKLYIPVILGTAREGRQSEKVARFVLGEAKQYGFKTELVDVKNFLFGHTGRMKYLAPAEQEKIKPWRDIVERADGFIVVSPEYNHGYPGELKMLLDSLYQEYKRKPVALCGVSGGPFGGARMVEGLKLVFNELQMPVMRNAGYFGTVQNLFNDDGTIKDEAYKVRLKDVFDELLWYAKTLKANR